MMRWIVPGLLSLLQLTACTADPGPGPDPSPDSGLASDSGPGADAGPDSGSADAGADSKQIVQLTTDDGLTLEADLWSPAACNGAGVVLLHMTPSGGNDRTNYPDAFIEKLVARDLTVLNVDRRGVGTDDASLKQSAYLGPNGVLDAKAAYDFLLAQPCTIDPARVVMVGASNGTTTALDFAIFAESDAVTEIPSGLVFLTGGSYTENQFAIADHRALLDRIPILFVYAQNEAGWSEQQRSAAAPEIWTFLSYSAGDHGTRMFTAQPDSMEVVAAWIGER
jgi:hypothetical protein